MDESTVQNLQNPTTLQIHTPHPTTPQQPQHHYQFSTTTTATTTTTTTTTDKHLPVLTMDAVSSQPPTTQKEKAKKCGEKEEEEETKLEKYYGKGNEAWESEDYRQALEWFLIAAKGGHTCAQFMVGDCYFLGHGVMKDEQKAVEWFLKAAEGGHSRAQYKLGICYFHGKGVTKDQHKAVDWCKQAIQGGYSTIDWEYRLIKSWYEKTFKDDQKTIEWYVLTAEGGSTLGQRDLGMCYYHGKGVNKDVQKAVEWFQKAAEGGDVQSYSLLGLLYYWGVGVEQSFDKALENFQFAATNGSREAQSYVGLMLFHGKGVQKNEKQAVMWWKQAAHHGYRESGAMTNLGISYKEGRGVKQSDDKAIHWLTKGAKRGSALAKFLLTQYSGGGNVPTLQYVLDAIDSGDSYTFQMIMKHKPTPLEVVDDEFQLSNEPLDMSSQEPIGGGNFGKVSKCQWKNQDVAFKQLKFNPFENIAQIPHIKGSEEVKIFMKEIKLVLSLPPHENVHKALGFSVHPLGLITELMTTDLKAYLLGCETLELKVAVRFAKQIAKGLDFLHKSRLIHRDVAARNVLLDENLVCKITDFGLTTSVARHQQSEDTPTKTTIYEMDMHNGDYWLAQIASQPTKLTDILFVEETANREMEENKNEEKQEYYTYSRKIGNKESFPLRWMAPECVDCEHLTIRYSLTSDVWSYGVLVWEIFSFGATPYPSGFSLEHYKRVQQGYLRLDKPSHCPSLLWNEFASPCFLPLAQRPTMGSIVKVINDIKLSINNEELVKNKERWSPPTKRVIMEDYAPTTESSTGKKTPIQTEGDYAEKTFIKNTVDVKK